MSRNGFRARMGGRADREHDKRGTDQAGSARPLKFYTPQDVAQMLDVSIRTVRRWMERRELAAHRLGGVVRIAEADLKVFLALHRED